MARRAVNGTELFVESVGDGPALIMMHGGLGLDHTYFRPAFDQLSDIANVVYYDHRCNGRSAPLAEGGADLTLENLVADTIGLLDDLGIERATLLGHSYGGFIAQLVAAAHPDRLSGLVLANTVPAFDYAPEPSGTDAQLAAFGQLFSGPAEDDATWASLWRMIWPMYFHRYDADEAARVDADTHYRAAAWNASAGLLGSFNVLDDLPGLTMPTLVIGGTHDFITPPDPGASRIADLVPNAELALFDNSGHYPFMEEHDEFFGRLRAFLTGLGG